NPSRRTCTMNRTITTTVVTTLWVGLLGAIGAACGEDADADTTDLPATTVAVHESGHESGHDDDMSITIEGVDYGFTNVPESVESGTKLGFSNTSSVELHELVAFRVDSDATLE